MLCRILLLSTYGEHVELLHTTLPAQSASTCGAGGYRAGQAAQHPQSTVRAHALATSTSSAITPEIRSDVQGTVPAPVLPDRITGWIGHVCGDAADAGDPTCRAVLELRQALPNAEGVFRSKAPDPEAAARLTC